MNLDEILENILNRSLFGNTVRDYITALAVFLVSALILMVIERLYLRKISKSDQASTSFLRRGLEKFLFPVFFLSCFFVPLNFLKFDSQLHLYINYAYAIIGTLFAVRFTEAFLGFLLHKYADVPGRLGEAKKIRTIQTILNFAVWTIGLLVLLSNLGLNVSTIVAGLGIGSIAVALAAQAVLGDLFSYFVIFFDRPFEIGDSIQVDDKSGTVEAIGIKSTRIRAAGGELLIISNSNLCNSRLHNFKKMHSRIIRLKFSLSPSTEPDLLREVPKMLKDIVDSHEDTLYERCSLRAFGAFGLDFELIYRINNPDYANYMDVQAAVNFSIFEELQRRGIKFPSLIKDCGSEGRKSEIQD